MSPNLAQMQSGLSRFSNRGDRRVRIVQIGDSPAAVITPSPNLIDISARDVQAIAGVSVGISSGPSYGYKCAVPLIDLQKAIAAGATTTGDTTFYRYSVDDGSCLARVPTPENPGQGAEWKVTAEDVQRSYWVDWPRVQRGINTCTITLLGALQEREVNATLIFEQPSTFTTDPATGRPTTPANPVTFAAYLQSLPSSPWDSQQGIGMQTSQMEGRLVSPRTLGFIPGPGQEAITIINGIQGKFYVNPTPQDFSWLPVPNLGQRISGRFVAQSVYGGVV